MATSDGGLVLANRVMRFTAGADNEPHLEGEGVLFIHGTTLIHGSDPPWTLALPAADAEDPAPLVWAEGTKELLVVVRDDGTATAALAVMDENVDMRVLARAVRASIRSRGDDLPALVRGTAGAIEAGGRVTAGFIVTGGSLLSTGFDAALQAFKTKVSSRSPAPRPPRQRCRVTPLAPPAPHAGACSGATRHRRPRRRRHDHGDALHRRRRS